MSTLSVHTVHRWGGWVLGAALIFQAMTGLVCTFRGELNSLLYESKKPSAVHSAAPSAGAIVERFAADFPDLAFERLFFPGSLMGETWVVWARTRDMDLRVAIYDPAGELLKAGPVSAFPAELVFFLHAQLLAGRTGQTVVGAFGVLLVLMGATGFVRWSRTSGPPARAMKLHAYARWLGRHRSLGIVMALLAILIGGTGGFLGLKAITASVPQSLTPRPLSASAIDHAVSIAQGRWPEAALWSVATNPVDAQRVTVLVRHRDSLPPRATDQLTIDAATGSTRETPFASQSFKSQASAWAHGLHSGEWLGASSKPLMIVTGLGLAGMAVLGYALTFIRLQKRRRAS